MYADDFARDRHGSGDSLNVTGAEDQPDEESPAAHTPHTHISAINNFRDLLNDVSAACTPSLSLGDSASVKRKSRQVHSLFEPLVVEYLSLESVIAQESWWDILVFQVNRRNITSAKVESLWAFAEAHIKILEESNIIDRFPQLVEFINKVIRIAKRDLEHLAELQPRKFFFAKHGLALRILLNRRLQRLEKIMASGLISKSDGSLLEEAFHERISQAQKHSGDLFQIGWCLRRSSGNRPVVNLSAEFFGRTDSFRNLTRRWGQSDANAWDNLTL